MAAGFKYQHSGSGLDADHLFLPIFIVAVAFWVAGYRQRTLHTELCYKDTPDAMDPGASVNLHGSSHAAH